MDDDRLNSIQKVKLIVAKKANKPSTLNTIQPTRLLERQLPFLRWQKTKQEQNKSSRTIEAQHSGTGQLCSPWNASIHSIGHVNYSTRAFLAGKNF